MKQFKGEFKRENFKNANPHNIFSDVIFRLFFEKISYNNFLLKPLDVHKIIKDDVFSIK